MQLREAGGPSLLRAINLRATFDLIHNQGPVVAPQVVRGTGLSQPTVREVLCQLLDLELITRSGQTQGLRGPRAQIYTVNPRACFALGIDVGREWVRAELTDLSGTVVARTQLRSAGLTAPELIAKLRQIADELTEGAGIALGDVDQIVVGCPGRMRPGDNHLSLAPNLPGWEAPDVVSDIQRALVAPVLFENDANLSAIAEHVMGCAKGLSDFVLISIGTGAGMGVILDGELRRGATGLAGEIGYLALDMAASGSRTEPSWGTGAFENLVSSSAILEMASSAGMRPGMTAADVFKAARAGDPAALGVLEVEAWRLAHAIAAVSSVLDPELVILGGGIGAGAGDLLLDPIRDALASISPFTPELAISTLGSDGVVKGAGAVGLRAALDRRFEREVAGQPQLDGRSRRNPPIATPLG